MDKTVLTASRSHAATKMRPNLTQSARRYGWHLTNTTPVAIRPCLYNVAQALRVTSPTPPRCFSTTRSQNIVPIPYVTETTAGVQHATDLFSKLLKERIVCVYGTVDEQMAARVTASLLFLEADNPSAPISMYIDSYGGSVTSGLAIHDTMEYISPEVSTICLGSAMSMGSLLLSAGAKGKRYCLPHSSIMLHQPSGGYSGQTSDILIHAKHISRIRDQLNRIYLKNLTKKGLVIEDVEKLLDRDNFLDAQEAKEIGIIDEVLASRKEVPEKKND